MPPNTIYVGRPTKWGNPFTISEVGSAEEAIALYRSALKCASTLNGKAYDIRGELRGKDLACWCPLVDKDGNKVPCHADVLLEIANA